MPTLQMTDVTKSYRTDLVETRALDRISLTVEDGEFVAVSGPSGSGKTTFLNVTGLLDGFESGTYLLDGKDVSRLTDREQSRIRNEKIGFVFQSFNLIPDLDVFDNVDVPLRYRGLPAADRRRRIESAITRVGLAARLHHLPSQLSGGQQQRVAIARALAGEPRLILADEPTGNLDSSTAHEIMSLLHEVNDSGTTIVMVTHDPGSAAHAARQLHILDGRLIDLREEMPSIQPRSISPAATRAAEGAASRIPAAG
ncbi:MAG: ABC transporter ATP-binding protein [Thermoanaerobaculia bacterium]|jgi:putative ABC transport system ATP-binding protein|nr:MAG: ABC transporter ATP-binding protein [Thermoanaerobaculia bacterium]MBZ0101270.1 ABC transporter ATP-binding protein [Thermoanaerobaculia bacterium]